MHYKDMSGTIKMDVSENPNTPAYQIAPYDYYVSDYFLAKSLQHVLRYADDEILYEVAIDESVKTFKVSKEVIKKHVQLITKKE